VITVLIVDDHPMVRAGLASLLATTPDLQVIGEAADGYEAVNMAARSQPDVVLMDLSMPGMGGAEATRRLRSENPTTQVMVLTSFQDQAKVKEALTSGAVGYMLKDSEPESLIAAVRAAALGHAPLDPRVARALLPSSTEPINISSISMREREVLALVTKGLSNKQIASKLGITERTVKVHLGHLYRRIGVTDRTAAALWAVSQGNPVDPAAAS
jgi:DNA-binding NarL/FixJ family response regulator